MLMPVYGATVAEPAQVKYNRQIDSLIRALGTPKLTVPQRMDALLGIGIFYSRLGEYDSAHVYLNHALEMPGGREYSGGRIVVNLANLYMFQGKYAEALKYYLEALRVAEKIGGASGLNNSIRAMSNISETYYMLGNRSQALYYAVQALDRSEAAGPGVNYLVAQLHYIVGSVYLDRGELDAAEENMLKTYEISDDYCKRDKNNEGGMLSYKSYGMEGLAKIYRKRKECTKALEYAGKSLEFAEEHGDPMISAKVWSTFSDIYQDMGQYEESRRVALKALEISSVSIELQPDLAFNIAAGNLFSGDTEQAYEYFRRYAVQMERNTDKNFHETMTSMEIQYETERKELRIASLEKEKKLYTWLGVAGVLLAIALGMVLWQNIRNARKEKQLIATRAVLDGEMGERSRLARDLHDRLSGNLAAVKIGLGNSSENFRSVSDKLDTCIDEIRRVAHNLMPVSLQYGLKVALEDFTAQFPGVHFHFFGGEKRLGERQEFVLYCCVGELVNNSLRHSGATRIDLQLVQDEKLVSVTVQDNGCGFDEKTVVAGIGLRNIRGRVASCGGKLDIVTSPGKGTETTIELKTGKI